MGSELEARIQSRRGSSLCRAGQTWLGRTSLSGCGRPCKRLRGVSVVGAGLPQGWWASTWCKYRGKNEDPGLLSGLASVCVSAAWCRKDLGVGESIIITSLGILETTPRLCVPTAKGIVIGQNFYILVGLEDVVGSRKSHPAYTRRENRGTRRWSSPLLFVHWL